ncbi:hypothetical protein COCC4DRAFT_66058 [Bipolaris maydis ATCC 48331]|uniref:Uncharacterized protein n=2 Tax=Cochliobolus heterostrophus TaxID=5016 RepID=M2UCT8_COCH5|nr:uncharacterized protein COCC4DRAFT_66058 [Bipolaris maydis ATCC 48331]EMD85808.1 hypothetical protein COCHEDRAFT_1117432 [Bipolaris maydis C5]KAJ5026218.1 hypothetical protein J3E73DRAFT_257803 [Bipolaris maydis]ENH99805.1 hypothetical protein COCC4DRAFT_66058 [Bipolaris maydis ATCC 48331]KAJ5056758.1 hypothetical protein J3E74DRAFT_294180 [Bipolaris maydis]KAJ6208451.1 hypothetical protein PSV09DRAFT_1117432 [Bipolaris maydis]
MNMHQWLIEHCHLESTENEIDTYARPTTNLDRQETSIWPQRLLVRVDSHHSTRDTRDSQGSSNESRESEEETIPSSAPDTLDTEEGYEMNSSILAGIEALLEDSDSYDYDSNSDSDSSSNLPTPPLIPPYPVSPIEQQTMMLHQDLISLFIHHRVAAITISAPAPSSLLAVEEMETLMSHYESSLSCPLYSGLSVRIYLSILYTAYIISDRFFFPRSPFATLTFSYLSPTRYMASRLRRQRVSSEILVVFQNLQTVMRELEAVTWGRRRYLRRLGRYPEVVARTIWMLDPTVTHRWDGPLVL